MKLSKKLTILLIGLFLVTGLVAQMANKKVKTPPELTQPFLSKISREKVDKLFSRWDKKNSPGAAVAIVKDGAIVYKNAYGFANLEYDIANTPSTIFHIASVSKQFTVFSILLLEKEGKLSLDDDIRKHIPEVPDFGHKITLRHLASHTSGLRDQWNLLALAGWRLDDVITKEHVMELVARQKELNFNPGDEYTYCNTGFTLLAEVVARVSKTSFNKFTTKHIFQPLGMTNTLFYDDHEKVVKNRAYSYYKYGSTHKKSVLNYANVGATSLFTTVEDLSKWSMNFSNPKVGSKDIINTMNTPAVLNNGKSFGGALGQFVGKYKGLNEIQHGGADAGYRSFLTRFPDQNFAVIVFSNAAEFNSGSIAHKIVDICLEVEIKKVPNSNAVTTDKKSAEEFKVDKTTITTYLGDYELEPGVLITITEEYGKLIGKATGQDKVTLKPISATSFILDNVDVKLEFVPNGNKKVNVLKLHQGGNIMEASRIAPFDKNKVVIDNYTGHYFSDELSTSYHLINLNGKLIVKHIRLKDTTLEPIQRNTFSGSTWYLGRVEFIVDKNNNVSGFKVSSGRVRNLVFQKVK